MKALNPKKGVYTMIHSRTLFLLTITLCLSNSMYAMEQTEDPALQVKIEEQTHIARQAAWNQLRHKNESLEEKQKRAQIMKDTFYPNAITDKQHQRAHRRIDQIVKDKQKSEETARHHEELKTTIDDRNKRLLTSEEEKHQVTFNIALQEAIKLHQAGEFLKKPREKQLSKPLPQIPAPTNTPEQTETRTAAQIQSAINALTQKDNDETPTWMTQSTLGAVTAAEQKEQELIALARKKEETKKLLQQLELDEKQKKKEAEEAKQTKLSKLEEQQRRAAQEAKQLQAEINKIKAQKPKTDENPKSSWWPFS